jgi:phosphopantetheine--protein transferase-like protein
MASGGRTAERPAAPAAGLPFIGRIVSHSPGEALVCLREIDVDEEIFLRHHTLGAQVSDFDERLTALPVMPLTVSMEMLAEAAATLMPGRCLVGMREVRAYRWMAFDEGRLTLRITAERAGGDRVRAEVREAEEPGGVSGGPPIVEGIMVFADRYPEAPAASDFAIRDEQPMWQPDGRLYSEGMFHGPSFQGVVSLDRCGEDGIEATLEALAADRLFRSPSDAGFVTDAGVLDAAGQLVGFWGIERLERGFNVFPYHLRSLEIYGPPFAAGDRAKGRARIALVGDAGMCSDIDVIGPDRHLRMRLLGWEDRRFDMPSSLYRLRISPQSVLVAEPWPVAVAALEECEAIECRRVTGLSDELLDSGGGIWRRVLAQLVLSRTERAAWSALERPEAGRNQWLLGRIAAKDAVRAFAARRHGLRLCAADVEIVTDDDGRPRVTGAWVERIGRPPLVSLSHVPGLAVAAAADAGRYQGVGIDVERLGRVKGDFAELAFGLAERDLLESTGPAQDEWALRCWCAKEALAKALGRGFLGDPQALVIREIDRETGRVRLALAGRLAATFPDRAKETLAAETAHEGDLIVGVAVIERAAT